MMELFLLANEGARVSEVQNRDFANNSAGMSTPELPEVVIELIKRIDQSNVFLSSNTNLTQQFVTYFQYDLKDLDECLLKYISPIYNEPVLLKRVVKKTGFF
jgi:hypothetical protein